MRKTLRKVGLTTAAVVLLSSSSAYAQATDTASVNVTVTVASRARLTLGAATLNFTDEDPDTVLTLNAPALTVNVGARTASASSVTLTVLATTNLTGTAGNIPINQLTWAGSGAGFALTGVSNIVTAQNVGTWTGPGSRAGDQTYSLPNSWAYAPGTYTTTLNYTLTVP
jgi:hypothetical protein